MPVAIVNEFVDGDIYRWGSLMAGALVGSLPLVVLYAFFVEHYVSAMTGAVKGKLRHQRTTTLRPEMHFITTIDNANSGSTYKQK